VRSGLTELQQDGRGGSSDSSGAPRVKETRLDPLSCGQSSAVLQDRITDYFNYTDLPDFRAGPASPNMSPALLTEVEEASPGRSDSSPASPLSDSPDPSSCGNSDSGKENEEEERDLAARLAGRTEPSSGRVTRSKTGKVPLSLKSCETLQNEFNIAEGGLKEDGSGVVAQSPPTPHKIIRVKEPSSLLNPLQKLKSISLTPKKSTKAAKSGRSKGSSSADTSAATASAASPAPATGSKAAKLAQAATTSHKVTEYFPIRRSERRPKAELVKQQLENIEARLLASHDSDLGIEITQFENKGRGITASKGFAKGEFVVEYAGDLMDIGTAKQLETKYSMDTSKGCYMYYFKHKGKQYCIDATAESGRYGRLLNHSRQNPNCVTKVVMLGDTPRLILVARQDIQPGTELLYDYGDRSKDSLAAHPWLAL